MSKGSKIFIGLISFSPVIFTIIIVSMALNMIPHFFAWDKHEPDFYTVYSTIIPLIIMAIISCLVSLGLLIFFIIHMMNNKKMESVEKLIWILAFFFVGIVGYPLYWYMRVWNDQSDV